MSKALVTFDEVRDHVTAALKSSDLPENAPPIYVVRDLFGKINLSVSENEEAGPAVRGALRSLAQALRDSLGAHGRAGERTVLWVDPALLNELRDTAQEIVPGVFWADRLLIGDGWWRVGGRDRRKKGGPIRYTLYSIKGGVGRSTTAAVLAWHLARRGEDVLVVDLDIESPGLASAVLTDKAQPKFGVADWFVEELVGQGDDVLEDLVATPAWAHDLRGNVWVAPAHGRDPGEYLAKLGRVYMDTAADPWTGRLQRLLGGLETTLRPTIVLIESRSGLHDIAAATVTDLDAEVMLFAVNSPSTWTGYGILFEHWRAQGLAPQIREHLSIVSALTPEVETRPYLERFQENAWDLFRDQLYDPLEGTDDPTGAVSYDLWSEEGLHNPLVIHWNRGFAAGASLRRPQEAIVGLAYSSFLRRFDRLHEARAATMGQSAKTIVVHSQFSVSLSGSARFTVTPPTTETVRIALSELPEEIRHGDLPRPAELYLPPSHRKALGPNVSLVTGMRGSGKTFWWSALQDPQIRTLLAQLDPRLEPVADTEVRAGFGVTEAPDHYPGRDELRKMIDGGIAPRLIWRTVHARHLVDSNHPLKTLRSWVERAKYVDAHAEDVARLFRNRDDELERQKTYSIVLFDGLDRSADEWPEMLQLIRGLLQHALDMRSYRRLRVKVFLRSDQADGEKVANFGDASKIFSSAVQLTWPRRDLYGMLWQYLGNGDHGELVRPLLAEGEWLTEDIGGQQMIFRVPPSLSVDETIQRKCFHAITGPWMGKDPRRGFPYTWIPNHLGDAEGTVSPRSFIAALRTAAEDTAARYPDHNHALHYESVKRGVQKASEIRVQELREDYPWVDRLLGSLSGIVVPCEFEEIGTIWKDDGILDSLAGEILQDEVKLPPRNIDREEVGVREDLESMGVFRRLHDGRVDIPDVFRVGYGLGRKGGVKPVR